MMTNAERQLGLHGEALSLAERLAARSRHESRVRTVLETARVWAERRGRTSDSAALIALLADMQGVGGGEYAESRGKGLSARRFPSLSHLGSGHKGAADGPAWTAAIAAAAARLDAGRGAKLGLALDGEDVCFALEIGSALVETVPVSADEMDWALSVARRIVGRLVDGDDVPVASVEAADATLNGSALGAAPATAPNQ